MSDSTATAAGAKQALEVSVQRLRSAGWSENTAAEYLHRLRLLSEVAADPGLVTSGQLEELRFESPAGWVSEQRRAGCPCRP